MTQQLSGKRIAILVTDGFEQIELTEPKKALEMAGAQTQIVSPAEGQVKGWKEKEWGDTFPVDIPLKNAHPGDFDGLLLPGGVMNPDKLRILPQAMEFVKAFWESGKPIAAICHGPWSLVETGIVRGYTLTSWPSLQTDIRNAGGYWVDREVVTDTGLVTSRNPGDIPAFNQKMIEEFAEGFHNRLQSREPMQAEAEIGMEHVGRAPQRPPEGFSQASPDRTETSDNMTYEGKPPQR